MYNLCGHHGLAIIEATAEGRAKVFGWCQILAKQQ